jgi:hypothetical protein
VDRLVESEGDCDHKMHGCPSEKSHREEMCFLHQIIEAFYVSVLLPYSNATRVMDGELMFVVYT